MKIYLYPGDKNLILADGRWHDNAKRISRGIISLHGDKYGTYTVSCGADSDFSYTGCFYPDPVTMDQAKDRVDQLIHSNKIYL